MTPARYLDALTTYLLGLGLVAFVGHEFYDLWAWWAVTVLSLLVGDTNH